jgi:hypothetical protein
MLLAAAAVAALTLSTVVQLGRGSGRSASLLATGLAAVVAVYGAALVGTGLTSRPQDLRPGAAKCFDDWCAAMLSARQDPAAGTVVVDVQLQNRGRGRAMRSNLARAYLEVQRLAQVPPEDGSPLQTLLQPGQRTDVLLTFPRPPSMDGVRFVVVEGQGGLGPGLFEIGGEGSPFHAKAGWPIT